MFPKAAFLLTAALIASAVSATPAWSQLQNCFVCHCCDPGCIFQGAIMGGGGAYGFQQQPCWVGQCTGPCGQTEESPEVAAFDVNGVWADLNTFDVKTIQEKLRAHPDRLAVNWDRTAIQMIGCNKEVVGHLQLPKATAAALATEEGL